MDGKFIPAILSTFDNNGVITSRISPSRTFSDITMYIGGATCALVAPLYISGIDSTNKSYDMYIQGYSNSSKYVNLFLNQGNSNRLFPNQDSGTPSGYWINSDGGLTNMWSYVDDNPYDSFVDLNYITSYQNGYSVNPENIYWVCDSGIIKYNLQTSGITKIMDGDDNTALSSHISYSPVDDFIYYGVENGNQSVLYRIDNDGNRKYIVSSNIGPGLSYISKQNTLYSLTKDGNFKSLENETVNGVVTSLLGRESLNRRTKVDNSGNYIYALQTESTSYLTKIYRYNIDTSNWEYLRILTYGLFGGVYDIDHQDGYIYYAGTSDYFTSNFYGIIRENIWSGSGQRIVTPSSPNYYQTREILYDTNNRKLYYTKEDVSQPQKSYNLVCGGVSGEISQTILSVPDFSGMKAMVLDGGMYKSYINFELIDFNNNFGLNSLSDVQVQNAYVSIKAKNNNNFSYIRAKLLTSDKNNLIWNTTYSENHKFDSASGIIVEDFGYSLSSINQNYNTANSWNNSILRISVAENTVNNSGQTTIYGISMDIFASNVQRISTESGIYMSTLGSMSDYNYIPLHTISDASIKSVDLYINNGVEISSGFDLYMIGHMSASSGISLYTFGQIPSGSIPLVITGHASLSSGIPMYTSGVYRTYNDIPMFLSTVDPIGINSNLSLFTYSTDKSGIYNYLPLSINCDTSGTSPISTIPMYLYSNHSVTRNSNIPLYLYNTAPSLSNNFDLCVGNYYNSMYSGINLYMSAPSGTDGAIPKSGNLLLFLNRDYDMSWGGIPLTLYTSSQSMSGINMIIDGVNYIYNYVNMYTSGLGNVNNHKTLYTHGY